MLKKKRLGQINKFDEQLKKFVDFDRKDTDRSVQFLFIKDNEIRGIVLSDKDLGGVLRLDGGNGLERISTFSEMLVCETEDWLNLKFMMGGGFVEFNLKRREKIYIAGPISGIDDGNKRSFDLVEKMLTKTTGAIITNPHKIPHKNINDWLECMREDIPELMKCDTIFMLKGWSKSEGAPIEHDLAKGLNMRIMGAKD